MSHINALGLMFTFVTGALTSVMAEESTPARKRVAPESITTRTGRITLLRIPAGEFTMGSRDDDKEADTDEKPRHPVKITRPFYLGLNEVTQGQYKAVTGKNRSFFEGSENLPIEQVSWNEAITFCNKLSQLDGLVPYYQTGAGTRLRGDGYRLPTEAEWEFACRAGSAGRYSFGETAQPLGQHAWFMGNSMLKTHPVGEKRSNAFGLHDMYGNVWEWCSDGYDARYYQVSPGVDPFGPTKASGRVFRGGSFANMPRRVRSGLRASGPPDERSNALGFRVARSES